MHATVLRRSAALLLACASIAAHAQAPQPGVMHGRVLDARGAPLSGVEVIADNTFFHDTNALGISAADGRYSIDVSRPAGTWVGSAKIRRTYNGQRYLLNLEPDTLDAFAGNAGAVRNFAWHITGERRDGLGTYGMPVIYYFDLFEDPQYPGDYLDTDHVELTLVPVGPLIDGSTGRTIRGLGTRTPDGPALTDVPIGRYTITGRYLAPERPARPLLLRVRNSGDYVPALTTDFTELMETLYRIEMDVTLDTAYIFDGEFEPAPTPGISLHDLRSGPALQARIATRHAMSANDRAAG